MLVAFVSKALGSEASTAATLDDPFAHGAIVEVM
jgi:hypothetical protein